MGSQKASQEKIKMKAVLDTNVIISSIFWKQHLEKIFELVNNQEVLLCFSPKTIEELYRVANYPHIYKKIQKDNIDIISVLDTLIANSKTVNPISIPDIIKEDASDNHFLACAAAAGADYIISGDKHLLKLKSFQNIPIITPRKFVNYLNMD